MEKRILKVGPAKTEQIVERIRRFESAKEIAFALNINVNSVYRVLKDRGYEPVYLNDVERSLMADHRNPAP